MHHFDDLPEDLQKELDNVAGEKYLRYFTDRFPRLFWHIYTTVARSDLGKEPKFGSYFPSNEHHSGLQFDSMSPKKRSHDFSCSQVELGFSAAIRKAVKWRPRTE